VVAVGYSNGANIAAGLLLFRPPVLHSAVLFHPMIPFVPEATPDLSGKRVFIGAGRNDPLVPVDQTEGLADLLRGAGAGVTLHWESEGHGLSRGEVEAARAWLRNETRHAV
jgi:phospholipase/carboxylesterase